MAIFTEFFFILNSSNRCFFLSILEVDALAGCETQDLHSNKEYSTNGTLLLVNTFIFISVVGFTSVIVSKQMSLLLDMFTEGVVFIGTKVGSFLYCIQKQWLSLVTAFVVQQWSLVLQSSLVSWVNGLSYFVLVAVIASVTILFSN
jgi:hypothetical protein